MWAAAAVRRLRHDRRGLYLRIAGPGVALFGAQVALDPRPGTVRAAEILSHILPLAVWGWVWIVFGTVAFLVSFTSCQTWRTIGFTLAEFPPLIWALGYTAAWIGGQYPQSWGGAAAWAATAFRLMVVAGWPDPPGVGARGDQGG